jgi:hypothetical protein
MRKVLAVSVGLLFMLGALASCGGSGSSKAKTDTKSGASTGNDEFDQLLAKQDKARIRVTYQTDSDTFTVSQDGNGSVAYIDKDSKVIKNGNTVTSCSGLPDNPDCQSLTGDTANAALVPFTAILTLAKTEIDAAKKAGGYGKETSETIAGRDADCVTITVGNALGNAGKIIGKISGANTDAGWKACADKQTGIMLLWTSVGTNDNNSGKIEATAVGDPQPDDFTTPSTTPQTDTSGSTETTETVPVGSGNSTVTTAGCPSGMTLPPPPTGMTYPAGMPCAGNG